VRSWKQKGKDLVLRNSSFRLLSKMSENAEHHGKDEKKHEHKKHEHHEHHQHHQSHYEHKSLKFGIVTCSDTRTLENDESGKAIKEIIEAASHSISFYEIVKEEPALLKERIAFALSQDIQVLITNGGTGISLRDSTIEVVSEMISKKIEGFGELFRKLSYDEVGASAMLSRAVAGVTADGLKLLFSLPGSTSACKLGLNKLIIPQVDHVYYELHKHEKTGK